MRGLVPPRASYFVASAGQPRVRRPRDIVIAVVGLLLIIWVVVTLDSNPSWDLAFTALVQSSPEWVASLLSVGYALSLVYALVVIGAVIAGGRERRATLRDLTIVALVAMVLTVILSLWVNGSWPYVFPEVDLQDPTPRFPVMRMAVVTAILVVVSPHVARPLRRFGWLAIATAGIAAVGLSYGSPSHVTGSFGVGLLSAGLLLVVAGSPSGYPDPDAVAEALRFLGVGNGGLEPAPIQTWGVVRFVGRDEGGSEFDVKVYGRDAFDSQLAAKMWHTLWYRETDRVVSYSRLQAVEHEALMTLIADRAGVSVPELLAVGSASPEISLIACSRHGPSLPEVEPERLTDDLLVETWSQLGRLHQRSMSHGALHARAVEVGPERPVITDFALASLAAEPADQASDVCELLFSLSSLVGVERAVGTAIDGLGTERVVAALPYLQLAALSPSTRRLSEKPKETITALRSKILDLTGADLPEPIELRRVTVRSLVTAGLVLLIAYAFLPALADVDYAEIWAVLQSADWALIVLALIVGHLQFIPQATATMFAVTTKLPFWPLLTLQTASQFISLAIPSAAGRVAMNAAFLHKFGIPIPVAVAQGAIDGFSGFLVQIATLIVVVLVGDVDLDLDIEPSEVRWGLVLAVLVLIVVGVVIVVL
ncbi:MAG TPA: lysylphosphatidylglycerol synthase domain-containing protein, partial [Acidimicrobiia bacterium]|nr:lysylphosphatidylglycerol synthase domain-containing protein [Acidimicrobiia bacterium]